MFREWVTVSVIILFLSKCDPIERMVWFPLIRGMDRVLDVIIPISDGLTASLGRGTCNSGREWESRLIYRPSRHCPLNLEKKNLPLGSRLV